MQTTLFPQPNTVCVFTGHRDLPPTFSKSALKKAIARAIEGGTRVFYNGLAVGFDLLAAELLLSFKKKNPALSLIVCIPCEGQEKYYSASDKRRYQKLRNAADEEVVLSAGYYKGCMLARDRYMADKADCMIAYCTRQDSGTGYTVRYFQRKKPSASVTFV